MACEDVSAFIRRTRAPVVGPVVRKPLVRPSHPSAATAVAMATAEARRVRMYGILSWGLAGMWAESAPSLAGVATGLLAIHRRVGARAHHAGCPHGTFDPGPQPEGNRGPPTCRRVRGETARRVPAPAS